jgi:hypothetical protein
MKCKVGKEDSGYTVVKDLDVLLQFDFLAHHKNAVKKI